MCLPGGMGSLGTAEQTALRRTVERIGQEQGWEVGKIGGGCNSSLAIADQRKTSFDLDLLQ